MSNNNSIVAAVYGTHTQAEQAVKELQRSGFEMKKLSIVAKNPHAEEQVVARVLIKGAHPTELDTHRLQQATEPEPVYAVA